MSTVQTTLKLQDRLSGPLQRMISVMNRSTQGMQTMDKATKRASAAQRNMVKANQLLASNSNSMTSMIERLHSRFSILPQPIERSMGAVRRFHATLKEKTSNQLDRIRNQFTGLPGPVGGATSKVRSFFGAFAGAAAAYLSIQGLANGFKQFVNASDTYVSTSARLGNINDGLQSQVELQHKIYDAAQRSRGAYVDMADSVAKLNLLAGDAFGSNDEAIKFTELMNKAFTISGAGTSEKQAGTHQLTQAMASGRLQGDEFVSITENAPLLALAIAKAMDVSMGELKKLSSEGKITAGIIKGALFTAADDIEARFKKMPMTFGQSMTALKNWALMAFEPLFIRFSEFVNSDAFAVLAGHVMWFVNVFIAGMTMVFDMTEKVYESWSWIEPLLVPIGAALGVILAGVTAVKVATMLWAGWQWAVNAAYLANPIGLIILVIVAAIASVIYAMIAWSEVTATVIGLMVGWIYLVGAVFYNVGAGMANTALAVAEFIANTFLQAIYGIQVALFGLNLLARVVFDAIANTALRVAEFFLNTWHDAVYGVQVAFNAMANMILTVMNGVASGVVATVNMALGAVSNLINGAVSGINSFIGVLNSVLGTDLSTVGTVDLKMSNSASSLISGMQSNLTAPVKAPKANLGSFNTAGDYASANAAPRAPGKVDLGRLDYKNPMESFANGVAKGYSGSMAVSEKLQGVAGKIGNLTDSFKSIGEYAGDANPFGGGSGKLGDAARGKDPSKLGGGKKAKNPTGGKLDSIGKIDKEINIADEDLKMLVDLAQNQAIQNTITLTPSVHFGDMTIREESDINKIIKKIETYFELEMSRSTDGLYT